MNRSSHHLVLGLLMAIGVLGARGELLGSPPGPAPAPGGSSSTSTESSALPERESLPLGPVRSAPADRSPAVEAQGDAWVLRTLTALGVVIALILLLRTALGRMGGAPAARSAPALADVIARTTIAPRTQLLFVRIGRRVVIVAHSSAGVQTVTEFHDPEEAADLLGRIEAGRPASITQGFRHLLQRFDRDYDKPAATREAGGDTNEQYVDRTRHELSGLLGRIRTLKQRGTSAGGEP